MDFKMEQFKLVPVIAFMLIYYSDCSAQTSRDEMIQYYKMIFLGRCTAPFEIDTGFHDTACSCCIDQLDKKSLAEIDSMCNLVADEIWQDLKSLAQDSGGDVLLPRRDCVIFYTLKQYESKDMDKLAKDFARRMRKVKPAYWRSF